MMDRFARICGVSLAALGLAASVAGCNQSSQPPERQASAVPKRLDPPRLLSEVEVSRPMDVPLTLSATQPEQTLARSRSSLQLPPTDRGAWMDGDAPSVVAPEADLAQHDSQAMMLPPSDREIAVGASNEEEAPLPELLPFETPAALADHAGNAPLPQEEATAGSASTPDLTAVAEDNTPAPSVTDEAPATSDVAQDDTAEATPSVSTVAETTEPAVEKNENGEPLVSTGALAINNIKSVDAAQRQVTRLEVPTGKPSPSTDQVAATPAPAPVPSAVETIEPVPPTVVESRPAIASTPVPAMEVASSPVEPVTPPASTDPVATSPVVSKLVVPVASAPVTSAPVVSVPAQVQAPPESLAVTQPAPQSEAAVVTPRVTSPQAPAAPSDIASRQPVTQAIDEAVPTARPATSSLPPAAATAAAPPSSMVVADEQSTPQREPRPATAMPVQPIRIANVTPSQEQQPASESKPAAPVIRELPARPASQSVAAHDPSGLHAIKSQHAPVTPPARLTESTPAARPEPTTQSVAAAPARPAPAPAAARVAPPAHKPELSARPVAEQFAQSDKALLPAAGAPLPMRSAELVAIARLADEHTRRGFALANRSAMYSARAEFIEALQMVAHAVDAERGTSEHSQALADGLTAINESDDFVSHGGRLQDNIEVVRLARPHHTPILKGRDANSISRLAAMQMYYTYAQRRLAFAVGNEPAGSLALYGLGKLYTVLAQTPPQGIVSPEPKAIVYHQASLMVDGRNYMAANDLGVLLARYGKYAQAKSALLHSLSVSPQPATWHNLTVVHQQLGEARLAELALAESKAAFARVKQVASANGSSVTQNATVVWLDPGTFAKSSELFTPATPNTQTPQPAGKAAPSTVRAPANAPPAKSGWFRK